MKIAFDTMGTLRGRDSEKVLRLYKALQARGHDMYVWSSEFSLAARANRELKLDATVQSKISKTDAAEWGEGLMDIAIDDDSSQTWLAARYIVLVRDIPNDVDSFVDKLVKHRTNVY